MTSSSVDARCIVVFNHRHIGDLICSFPALLALREKWPQVRLVNVAPPLPATLLSPSRLSDRVIPARKNWRDTLQTLVAVRREKPDLAISLSGSRRMMQLTRFSGAARRVGFSDAKYQHALTDSVPKVGPPWLEFDLRLVESLGCAPAKRDIVGLLELTDADRQPADEFLRESGVADEPLVGINVGASVELRRWGIDKFARVGQELERSGARLILFGGPGDVSAVRELHALLHFGAKSNARPALVAAGRFSARQSAALMARCTTFVTGDTGPMHLAVAVNTPVVALFGPVPASWRLPKNSGHIGLQQNAECLKLPRARCRDGSRCACLQSITPDSVIEAAQTQLSRSAG